MNLVDELLAVVGALRAAEIPYAVCGGLAVTIHGATRTTKDIDLLVWPADVPRAMEALRPLGYTFAALPMAFSIGPDREQRVQRVSKIEDGQPLLVDLILAEDEVAEYLRDAIEVHLPAGPLHVIARPALLQMKRTAGRPQDLADIERLEDGDG